jgi:hypothetical protein
MTINIGSAVFSYLFLCFVVFFVLFGLLFLDSFVD